MNDYIFLVLLISLLYAVLIGFGLYRAEKKQKQHERGFINDSGFLPYSLPLFSLAFCILALLFQPAQIVDFMIAAFFNIFCVIFVYYLILLIFLPLIRSHLSVTSIVTLWALPNMLYLGFNIVRYAEPLWIIETPGKLIYILCAVWMMGFVCVLLISCMDHLIFRRKILKDAIPLEDQEIVECMKQVMAELQYKRKMPVTVISPSIVSPCSIGLFPWAIRLVLPKKEWKTNELRSVLLHELIHLNRKDNYVKFSLVFMTAICWFNPFMWKAMRKSAQDIELSCDEQVLTGMGMEERKAYAGIILHTAGSQRGFTTSLSSSAQSLKYRISCILNPPKRHSGAAVCSVVMLVMMITCGMFSFAYDPQPFWKVAYDHQDIDNARIAWCYDTGNKNALSVTDEQGLIHYLSDMQLSRFTGNLPNQASNAMSINITLSDRDCWIILEDDYLAIADENFHKTYYYISSGNDWDYLYSITSVKE